MRGGPYRLIKSRSPEIILPEPKFRVTFVFFPPACAAAARCSQLFVFLVHSARFSGCPFARRTCTAGRTAS